MGFFDFLKKGADGKGAAAKAQPIDDPDILLERLILVVDRQDAQEFEILCRSNEASIEKHFGAWKNIPENLRQNQADVDRYATAIIAIAEFFQRFLNNDTLLHSLSGPDESNPIKIWEAKLSQARADLERMDFVSAEKNLRAGLALSEGVKGTAVTPLLSVTNGLLGQCFFHQGRIGDAFELVYKAQILCQEVNDVQGILSYTTALYQIARYAGKNVEASQCAEAMSEIFEQVGHKGEAEAWKQKAELAIKGEPLNRVQVVVNGVPKEVDELYDIEIESAKMQFQFKRNRITPSAAEYICQQGIVYGMNGRLAEAIPLFENASRIDPFDPEPHYKRAFTLLKLKRYSEAVEAYKQTEKLAPGWFQCRSDLWLAQQLQKGRFDHEAFETICYLADEQDAPEKKVERAKVAIEKYPDLAPLYLYLGKNLQAQNQDEQAADAYRKGLELCEGEQDLKTRLLVNLAAVTAPGEERTKLLKEAATLNGSLISSAMAQVMLNVRSVVA